MRTYVSRSVGAATAAAGLTLLSLCAASSANAGTLPAAQKGPAQALALAGPPAAASHGWQRLLKVRDANLHTIAAIGHNAWAGGYRVMSGAVHSLLEHWDGSTWHAVTLPARIDPLNGGIDYVTASAPGNVWISITHAGRPLVARWNGHRWQARTPGNIQLNQTAVTLGPADTWAFGGSLAGHFTASGWQISQLAVSVRSVSAVSSSDLWAFGANTSGWPTAAHWDGRTWAYQPVPRAALPAGFPQLLPGGIHAFGPADAWAVGTALTPRNPALGVPVVLHWNGRSWRRAYAGPVGDFGGLETITADGHHDLWMTSQFLTGQHTLLHEHNGIFTWLPGPPLINDQFYATDLTWLPGTPTLLFTGYLASEVTVQYGHVESYTP